MQWFCWQLKAVHHKTKCSMQEEDWVCAGTCSGRLQKVIISQHVPVAKQTKVCLGRQGWVVVVAFVMLLQNCDESDSGPVLDSMTTIVCVCVCFQAHLVAAFEQSLGNMTVRLQSLTTTAEQKVTVFFLFFFLTVINPTALLKSRFWDVYLAFCGRSLQYQSLVTEVFHNGKSLPDEGLYALRFLTSMARCFGFLLSY